MFTDFTVIRDKPFLFSRFDGHTVKHSKTKWQETEKKNRHFRRDHENVLFKARFRFIQVPYYQVFSAFLRVIFKNTLLFTCQLIQTT